MSAGPSTAAAFPERVGKYELLLPLGTGGTATVYLARTRGVAGFEREVALKLVHAHLRADEESRLHLLEEARLAARIRHPNVVPVTEVDADACGVFLVMDYVEGEALSGVVRLLRDQSHRLPPRLIARIMNDALAGLHAAHELRDAQGQFVGLVHRDFSPQNILLGVEGVTRLADFGVAKAASRTVRTKTGLVKGKVAYMSPEQARGHKVDRRCDVWAAGVVIWELVTGRKLYDHEDDVATLLSVVTEEPPRLKSVMQGVPPALDEAVAYALTSDVNNRCPSAEAFRCMLESAWDECGGMASTAELGAFVRQTVGQRLAERRAMVARGRTGSVAAVTSSGSPPALLLSAPPSRAAEDGTKTAISAAVPAAERVGIWRAARNNRRSIAVTALLLASVMGAAAMGVAVTAPDSTAEAPAGSAAAAARGLQGPAVGPSDLERTAPSKLPDPALGIGEIAPSPPAPLGDVDPTVPSTAAQGVDDAQRAEPAPGSATEAVTQRSSRRGPSRSKATQRKAKARAVARSASRDKSGRTQKAASAPSRPLPPSPVRQSREKAAASASGRDAPAPLNLAPDPYDSNR